MQSIHCASFYLGNTFLCVCPISVISTKQCMDFYDEVSIPGITGTGDGGGVVNTAQVETSVQQKWKILVLV